MSSPETISDADLAVLKISRADYEARLAGATAGITSNKPQVYWGTKDVTPPRGSREDPRPYVYPARKPGFIGPIPGAPLIGPIPSRPEIGPIPKVKEDLPLKDLDMAKVDILTWDEGRQVELANKLIAAGMLTETYSFLDLRKAWETLCDYAADHAKAGQKLTPFDMIDLYGGDKNASEVVSRQVTISNPDQARGLLDSALSSQLGRRATQTELDDFQAQLNSAQRANPTVDTTTYDASGHATQSVKTGGVDESNYTDKYARTGKLSAEYAHYQAATTYANALFKAIGAPV
jgi:hypothetical protein